MPKASEQLLLRPAAAKYLGLSLSGLAHMASRGAGPRYSREGKRVVYLKSDLDAWRELQAREAAARHLVRSLRRPQDVNISELTAWARTAFNW